MKANYNIKDNSELTKPQVHTGYIYIVHIKYVIGTPIKY